MRCSHAALRFNTLRYLRLIVSIRMPALRFLKSASSRQPELSNLSDKPFGGCRHCAIPCLHPSCLSSLQVMTEATVNNLKMIILDYMKGANIRQYKPVLLPRLIALFSLQSDQQDLVTFFLELTYLAALPSSNGRT